MPGTADESEAAEVRAQNARLREAVERLGLLNEDKDAVIAGLRAQLAEQAEQIARLERLISRNSGFSELGLMAGIAFPAPIFDRQRL